MKRRGRWSLVAVVVVLLGLAACVPTLTPDAQRDGDNVVIRLAPSTDLYNVTLSILNASTTDERCVRLDDTDLGCVIGNLPANTVTTVTVTGAAGQVRCRAFGYTTVGQSLNHYRTWLCA